MHDQPVNAESVKSVELIPEIQTELDGLLNDRYISQPTYDAYTHLLTKGAEGISLDETAETLLTLPDPTDDQLDQYAQMHMGIYSLLVSEFISDGKVGPGIELSPKWYVCWKNNSCSPNSRDYEIQGNSGVYPYALEQGEAIPADPNKEQMLVGDMGVILSTYPDGGSIPEYVSWWSDTAASKMYTTRL